MDYVSLGKTGLKVSRLCLARMSYAKELRNADRGLQIADYVKIPNPHFAICYLLSAICYFQSWTTYL
jgi:hypothetical protein